ncbi:MAG TPA: GrpB family protein [Vicinamibacterales bacterium]|jgi:GrpB-like predicted nucleotidyltransferase (UPF0157 family)
MIEIRNHDPGWTAQFERERARLAHALGPLALRIDHHGSTAVPGLAAKPIIDIQISVASLKPIEAYARPLALCGYVHRPHDDDSFAPFFHRPATWPHSHHVHVVQAESDEARRTLAFRDYLRAHPESARDYESLKRELAARFIGEDAESREAYASAKSEFVVAIVERALAEQDRASVSRYYNQFEEESRLASGPGELEFERTKDILSRYLPPPPARVVDVGGAAGVYSIWLAGMGYEVHLVDASERLVDEARRRSGDAARPVTTFSVSDARELPQADESADAVLVMGPLYHLTRRPDRVAALGEARRVLRGGGLVAVAAISRCASTLDGLARELTLDPRFVAIRDRDLVDGQHRNDVDNTTYFTTSYFHRPDDLRDELEEAGFAEPGVLGVEGPGWLMSDFVDRWTDPVRRAEVLRAARVLEHESSIVGVSAHLIGLGWKRNP